MNSKSIRIVTITILTGIGIYGVYCIASYYSYKNSPQGKAEAYIAEIEKMYAEDTYGGSTPEETLRLFVEALKKGDVDLAAKYFFPEKQGYFREYLQGVLEKGNLESMLSDITNSKLTIAENRATLSLEQKKTVLAEMVIERNRLSGKWKILEL